MFPESSGYIWGFLPPVRPLYAWKKKKKFPTDSEVLRELAEPNY